MQELHDDASVACDGHVFPVHKIVLTSCSDYFSHMLEVTAGKYPIIVLKDVKKESFKALLEFMYTGQVSIEHEKLPDLMEAADCLKIKGLTDTYESGEVDISSDRGMKRERDLNEGDEIVSENKQSKLDYIEGSGNSFHRNPGENCSHNNIEVSKIVEPERGAIFHNSLTPLEEPKALTRQDVSILILLEVETCSMVI